ncbi:MAG: FtsX-like permease family protein [Planctomycetaceae bacterium]
MTALHRKLLRDLLHMKGQALAISLVIASGIAVFVMAVSAHEALTLTRSAYYDRYRFADVFATMKRAPLTLADRIAQIPGVAQAEPRVVMDVTLDIEGLSEPAVGRMISIPADRRPRLNDVYLKEGRYIEPYHPNEVLVSDAFVEAHGFKPGDSFEAILNGSRQTLHIVGVALSPEYVLQIRPGELIPDKKRFAIIWMDERELDSAFDMEGAFNNITLTLLRGASEREIITRLDDLIEPYGGAGSHGRDEQLSARFLDDELKGLRANAIVSPTIFLSVAVFLLHVVITRVISTQREQIAALKAFGYTHWEVGLHYMQFVMVITTFGAIVGTAGGGWLGKAITGLYAEFYRFPEYLYRFDLRIVAMALSMSVIAAVIGTMSAVRQAVLLPPAEAMRPAPPAQFRETLIERLGWSRVFSASGRMIIRELERRPWKALMSTVGIAFAVAVLILGRFAVDAFEYKMDFQYFVTQRQDVSVTFVEPLSSEAQFEVQQLPGVLRSETYRTVGAKLRHEYRYRNVAILGLNDERELYRLIDAREHQTKLPKNGLMLSDKLAEVLHVKVGDTLTVEVLEGERPTWEVPVEALIYEFQGTNAYMSRAALDELLREQGSISGAYLRVDGTKLDKLYQQLKETPRVASVLLKEAALEGFQETIAENQYIMQGFNTMFACIIAFGVVYNTARISLSERSREMGTLRVIGFTRLEVSSILLGELAVITLAAIPVGFGVGYLFAVALAKGFETELFRIPIVLSPETLAFAAGVTIIASVISGLIVRRQIDHMDLVSVLKQKE